MTSPLRTALHGKSPALVFCLGQLCSPKFVEIVALHREYAAIWFDQEHVGLTIPQIEEVTRACRASAIDSFVRTPVTDYASIMRVLEAGAGGIMASMVRSIDQVTNLVRWAKFFPLGERGVNGSGVDGSYGMTPFLDYFPLANDRVSLGVQIEHIDALAILDEILAVDGIDYLFIGPADLSQSMGIPAKWDHPRLWEAIESVATQCGRVKKPWAILPFGADHARRCVELGCSMLSLGHDTSVVHRGMHATREAYLEFFPAKG